MNVKKDFLDCKEKELRNMIQDSQEPIGRTTFHNELVRRSVEKLNKTTTFLNIVLLILTGILVWLTFIMVKMRL